jgi:hypothetical protein
MSKARNHKAPRLFLVFHVAVAVVLLYYHAAGALPLTFSGPNGTSHFMMGCVILGAVIGVRSGWPRNKPPKHDVLNTMINGAKALGLIELAEMHQAPRHEKLRNHGRSC